MYCVPTLGLDRVMATCVALFCLWLMLVCMTIVCRLVCDQHSNVVATAVSLLAIGYACLSTYHLRPRTSTVQHDLGARMQHVVASILPVSQFKLSFLSCCTSCQMSTWSTLCSMLGLIVGLPGTDLTILCVLQFNVDVVAMVPGHDRMRLLAYQIDQLRRSIEDLANAVRSDSASSSDQWKKLTVRQRLHGRGRQCLTGVML
jgi:hypothetical protein